MSASASCYSCASVDGIWSEVVFPFLAYYGCGKLLKARAVFYWGTHTRFTVSVGIDLSLTKTRRTRSADCICMDKRARISPLWEIVYYLDRCIVAVRKTEYFTEILRNIPRMREQWCPLPRQFFPSPAKNGLGTRLLYNRDCLL